MKTSVAIGVVAVMLLSCSENPLAPRAREAADGFTARRAEGADPAYRLLLAPWRIERGTGKPIPVTKSLAARGYAPNAILHVRNGDASGAARVSSAHVLIDGKEILGPSDFSQTVGGYDLPITIQDVVQLSIEVDGKPGSYLTVSIDARPATSAILLPAGGVLYLLVDAVTLSAPAGAVSAPLVITANPIATPPMSGGVTPVNAVDMGPNGTRFAAPVTLSLAYDPATLPRGVPEALLRMFWWDGAKWLRLKGQTMDAVNHRVSALTDHFSLFALLPDYRFCPLDASSFTSLQMAVDGTPGGGTLVVCDGTHDVTPETPVRVNHPMTIRSEHPAGATLQRTAVLAGELFSVDGIASGTARFADITLRGDGVMIDAENIYDQLVTDSVSFVGNDTTSENVGVVAGTNSVPGARVTVTNSSFSRFFAGVVATAPVEFNTVGNVFDLFGWSGVQYQVGAYGRVANNTVTRCGTRGCIRAATADGMTIEQNTMSTASGSVARIGIFVRRRAIGGTRPFMVRDNTITGTAPSGDPANILSWSLSTAIQMSDSSLAPADTILRNRITNAWEALRLINGNTGAFDNTASGGWTGVTMFNVGSATIQRNDFLNFAVGIQQIFAPGTTTPIVLSAQCNWWGTTNGPASPGSVPGVDFFPWATQPIATTRTACDPQPQNVRVCPTAGAAGGFTVPTLAQAVSYVKTDGIVTLCDGTHAASNVAVRRPLRITSEGPGIATIDAGSSNQALNIGFGAVGAVTLRKLKFIGGVNSNVNIGGAYGTVLIDSSEFHPPVGMLYGAPLTYKNGIQIFGATGGGITVRDNSFLDGDIGVNVGGAAGVAVHHNTFDGQNNAGTYIGGGSTANGVVIDSGRYKNCGASWCIGMFGTNATTVSVVANTFLVDASRPTFAGIQQDIAGATATITDNVILGTGSNGADRSQQSSYPIKSTGMRVSGANVILSRNSVTNAFQAFAFQVGGAVVTGGDNVIQHVFSAFNAIPPTGTTVAVRLFRNDIADYLTPASGNGRYTAFDLSCSYWGANGPVNPNSGAGAVKYMPWASAPAAGTLSSCDPSLVISTLRVCPTAGPPGTFTVSTVSAGVAFAPVGGTVLVCDGTHTVQSVNVNKSLTIQAEGPGMPTLDAGGAAEVLTIFSLAGNVTVRGLRLQGSTSHNLHVNGLTGTVLVDQSEFHPFMTFPYNVDRAAPTSGQAGVGGFGQLNSLTIQNSTFMGGDIGVHVNTNGAASPANVIVMGSHFTGQSNAGVFTGGATATTVIHVEKNSFDLCGRMGCTKFFTRTGGRGEWVSNRFTIDISHPVYNVFNIAGVAGAAAQPTALIDQNEIASTGGTGDRAQSATYPIDGFAVQFSGQSATVTRNTINNAWHALSLNTATMTANDNTIAHVGRLVSGGAPSPLNILTFQRNDVTDFNQIAVGNNSFATLDLRCNYWGASGPQSVGNGQPSPQLLPWSTQPIAGQPVVACNPAAAITALRVCPTSSTGGPLTVATVATAFALLPAGGTINICDGTHAVTTLNVNKSMTFQAEGPGMPTLDGAGSPNSLSIANTNADVVIRGLRFQNSQNSNVNIGGTYGSVLVDASEFHPPQGQAYGSSTLSYNQGVFAGAATGNGITIQNSAFIGGDIGVHLSRTGNVTVRNNSFTGQTNAGVHGGDVNSSNVLVQNNTFTDCGLEWCIGFFGAGSTTISRNVITISSVRPTRTPITLWLDTGIATVEDNELTGNGGTGVRTSHDGYGILNNAIQVSAPTAAVNRNKVTNAWAGIWFTPASGSASDNMLTHVNTAFGGGGAIPASNGVFQRNDVVDYVMELMNPSTFVAVDLRCNWWGSASGPTNTLGLAPSVFTNFSTTPIAGKPGVVCNP